MEKSSITTACGLAVEIVPVIVTCALGLTADVSTGKFCRSFGPVSESPASLSVTPLPPRSIPSPAFAEMLLRLILSCVPSATVTPSPPLKAIVFAETVFPLAPCSIKTPSPPLAPRQCLPRRCR